MRLFSYEEGMLTALCALTLGFAPQDSTPHCSTAVLSSVSAFQPGKPFLLGFQIKMDKGWHCYWKNAGDSGEPTSIAPKVPAGWKAEPVVWPTPRRINAGGIVSYGYEGSPIFVTRVTPPKTAKSGSVGFDADWLICEDMCVKAKDSVRRSLKASSVAKPDATASKALAAVMNAAPAPRKGWTLSARLNDKKTISFSAAGKTMTKKPQNVYFFSFEPGVIDHGKHQLFTATANTLTGTLPVSPYAAKPPAKLSGILVVPGEPTVLINIPVRGD